MHDTWRSNHDWASSAHPSTMHMWPTLSVCLMHRDPMQVMLVHNAYTHCVLHTHLYTWARERTGPWLGPVLFHQQVWYCTRVIPGLSLLHADPPLGCGRICQMLYALPRCLMGLMGMMMHGHVMEPPLHLECIRCTTSRTTDLAQGEAQYTTDLYTACTTCMACMQHNQ